MKIIFKKYFFKFIVFILVTILLCSLIYIFYKPNSNINFYISTYGNDNSIGSKSHPFKTLEGARDAIRNTKKNTAIHKDIIVFFRGGNYFINKSIELEKIDSGNKQLFITYKSYKKEKVFFIGGYNLSNTDFKPLTDKTILDKFINKEAAKNILVADFSKYPMDFASSKEIMSNAPELFYNNDPMTIARFPNYKVLSTGQVIKKANDTINSFKYNGNEPLLWNRNKTILMSGYWFHNWSDSTIKVSTIDILNNIISSTTKLPYGIKEGQRFYFFNILEELDKAGEYYIDYDKKLLYFLPNSPIKNSKIQLSVLTAPFIQMTDVSNVTIEGITFENSRATNIVINNGLNNKIKDCVIRNTSQNAISINGGTNNGVENCEVYNTGTGGLVITGGNRNTLTPCNNYASNNEIYNFSRIKKTYSAAINISGVGIIASHNCIHDAPHTAILFSGNDHLLEYNEIYNVATETDDVGAIYTGRDWTFRGNIIKYNYLHDIDNNIGNFNVSGIYLDDCMSSAEVYGNVFYKVKNPIFIGGGRDNIIENNIIVDCKTSINFDERGLTWDLNELYLNLSKVPYESDIWTNKYPELKYLSKNGSPGIPNNNVIENNLLYQTKMPSISDSVIKYGRVKNNICYDVNPGFVNSTKMDFRLSRNSIIFKENKNFKSIPFENIGRNVLTVIH
ncbi:right-handed parallel beta-helix repeat-containing protein [Clostridium estertheticum]|uniref:right-handed parallel beta-helix repeat-containing protein n=1 Tax=Clostridium estertheticum TaxID=238834 RepID=UPI001C0A9CDC|nr:right-handed parallel beta-helix repeat-containing protein [Clostridium estertheticum]MBU3200979.1 right-handed parallel beta-helix repeat-containing protein [Clostridium estertheticum]WAG63401.1 right-handed parallel beta-helix repeat-containing protein [Clostridium estertheticum]